MSHASSPRSARRVLAGAVVAAVVALSGTGGQVRASDGFVTVHDTRLWLNGRQYHFTGLNYYNANSRDNCGPTPASLHRDFADWGPGGMVMRAWFYQELATTNGKRDWSAFDHTLAVARRHGVKVIATLADQWGDCEANEAYKTESWYARGYRRRLAGSGLPASYRTYVREIVARYRHDPTILAWQLVNEAEDATADDGPCSRTATATLKAFASDVAGMIKVHDRNHLVSLGTIGDGHCGTDGGQYVAVHRLRSIDVCEYHEYDAPLDLMPGDARNGLARRISQCRALGKPLIVGESGIKTASVGGLDARARAFAAKLDAEFAAGVAGFLPWMWVDA